MLHPLAPSLTTASALQAGHHRQRSLSDGRGRPGQPPNCPQPDLHALLHQVLSNQLKDQQSHEASDMVENGKFENVHKLISQLDPELKHVFLEWFQQLKAHGKAYANACELKAKYDAVLGSGQIMQQFKAESSRTWQFPREYAQFAVALTVDSNYTSTPFNVEESWKKLRLLHAQQCQSFISHHNSAAVDFYAKKLEHDSLLRDLRDRTQAYFAQFGNFYSGATKFMVGQLVGKVVTCAMMQELPGIQSRLVKASVKKKELDDKLRASETLYQQLSVKELLALHRLNKDPTPRKDAPSNAKSSTQTTTYVCNTSFEGQLLKDSTPSVLEELGISISHDTSKTKPSARAPAHANAKSRSRSASASASVKSWRSRSSSVRSTKSV